jgi:hypothetical protein
MHVSWQNGFHRYRKQQRRYAEAVNALAVVAPTWLLGQVTPDWFERYGERFEQYLLPKTHLAHILTAAAMNLTRAVH